MRNQRPQVAKKFYGRSHDGMIHVYDAVGNVIDPASLFNGRSQSNIRRISGVSHLFAFRAIQMSCSLMAREAFAERKLSANASCNA
jgi:hypothetical protein